jgi:two-component system, OmpR family, sensor histidine kinase VicK
MSGEEEKTETVYGVENTVPVSLQCFAQVKERHDSCGDDTLPSVIVTTEPIKNAYRELLKRGIKTRFITEISEKNIEYCKELMKIVYELRHLEGIKGNFGVSESDYIATAIQQQGRPIPRLIHSNARGMIEQQQYFFETLWDKAIPAEQKIREIEEGIPIETTEVVRGIENIIRNQVEGLSFTKIQNDACVDGTFPASLLSSKMVWDKCLELRNRGVKIRTITEITPKNIAYCKRMVERMELRHLDTIRGNFSISDKTTYRGSASMREGEPPTEGIYSTIRVFVEQQQYFFETLWNKAIPAKQRFKEIEQAAKREFVETIKDPYEIQKLGFDLIKRAEDEILILFSTANAFRRQAKGGALDLLKEAATLRGLKVRILVHVDDGDNKAKIIAANETIPQLKKLGIDIRQIKREEELYPLQNKLTMLIVDQSVCLTVESEEDKEETSEEDAIRLATYSNSESTVFTYASIFENLWMHTEMIGRHDSTRTHKRRHKNDIKTGRTVRAR